MSEICHTCGQIKGVREYDATLWDIYDRIDDGRTHYEPLVYTQDDLYDAGYPDEECMDVVMMSMEKNMHERGLCTDCGRPDLSGVDPERILSPEDARGMHEMHAEMAAERRMGA